VPPPDPDPPPEPFGVEGTITGRLTAGRLGPTALAAVTAHVSAFPTSDAVGVYEDALAPVIAAPFSCHRYE
jgi:hypothetical protein